MASETDSQQRKKQSWYIRNPEIREDVTYCVRFRLTEKESLDELLKSGHDISYRTFRRIKSDLEPNKQRLDKVIKKDILLHVVEIKEILESVQKRLFDIRKKDLKVSDELKVIREIKKTEKEILELYDSHPVIAYLLEREKKKNNNHVEKSTESS